MYDKLPPLSSLRGFEAVARLGSVRRAARELHLSHSAVSQQIQSLEDNLKVQLFVRTRRSMRLSAEGIEWYPQVVDALDKLQQGAQRLREKPQGALIRLQSSVSMAVCWLPQLLGEFKRQHPQITLVLQSKLFGAHQPQAEPPLGLGFDPKLSDIGVVYCEHTPPSNFDWYPVYAGSLHCVCAKTLLGNRDSLSPEEVLQYPLISVYTSSNEWSLWQAQFSTSNTVIQPPISVDTHASAIELAKLGHGIALINGPFTEQALSSGELVLACQERLPTQGAWGIICEKSHAQKAAVETFIQWLMSRPQQTQ